MTQLGIEDGLAAGEHLRDEAMVRVAQANPQWSDYADEAVIWVAERREFFSSDAVWGLLKKWSVEEPTDRRALGPVLKRATNAGLIESTGRVKKSQRKVCHAAPKLIYRSLIFGQGRARYGVAGPGGARQDEETGDDR